MNVLSCLSWVLRLIELFVCFMWNIVFRFCLAAAGFEENSSHIRRSVRRIELDLLEKQAGDVTQAVNWWPSTELIRWLVGQSVGHWLGWLVG